MLLNNGIIYNWRVLSDGGMRCYVEEDLFFIWGGGEWSVFFFEGGVMELLSVDILL